LAKGKEYIQQEFLEAITKKFGGWEEMKEQLVEQALDNSINDVVYGSY